MFFPILVIVVFYPEDALEIGVKILREPLAV